MQCTYLKATAAGYASKLYSLLDSLEPALSRSLCDLERAQWHYSSYSLAVTAFSYPSIDSLAYPWQHLA